MFVFVCGGCSLMSYQHFQLPIASASEYGHRVKWRSKNIRPTPDVLVISSRQGRVIKHN